MNFCSSTDHHLPEVGQTRCCMSSSYPKSSTYSKSKFGRDWALLSSSLDFLFLDPVLTYHLREQASLFLGRSLLDFVHPEEQDLARRDLGDVLDERALYGSVTRYVSVQLHPSLILVFNPTFPLINNQRPFLSTLMCSPPTWLFGSTGSVPGNLPG